MIAQLVFYELCQNYVKTKWDQINASQEIVYHLIYMATEKN